MWARWVNVDTMDGWARTRWTNADSMVEHGHDERARIRWASMDTMDGRGIDGWARTRWTGADSEDVDSRQEAGREWSIDELRMNLTTPERRLEYAAPFAAR